MTDNIKSRQNNLALFLVFVGASMGLSSKFKEEIEPYRTAARETLVSMVSSSSTAARAASIPPATPK